MTEYLKRPTQAGQISKTKSRVHTIERRLLTQPEKPATYVAKWSLGGILYLSESGYEMHPTGANLIRIYATLRIAGTTTTTMVVKKNGTTVGTIKMPAGVQFNEQLLMVPVSAGSDLLSAQITAVGTGANTLTVYGEFDR